MKVVAFCVDGCSFGINDAALIVYFRDVCAILRNRAD